MVEGNSQYQKKGGQKKAKNGCGKGAEAKRRSHKIQTPGGKKCGGKIKAKETRLQGKKQIPNKKSWNGVITKGKRNGKRDLLKKQSIKKKKVKTGRGGRGVGGYIRE